MEDQPTTRKRNANWTEDENKVLISGWIKFGTDPIVGRSQKNDSYWGKIANYCNEHCKFDPHQTKTQCRNRFNYMNKILGKWVGAYEKAKRMRMSGWSEDDVLKKAHELYRSDNNCPFTYVEEWKEVRDEPRYAGNLEVNVTSDSSGSKRARESDVGESNSVGTIPRPIGREAAKRKGKKKDKGVDLESSEGWGKYVELKEKEFEVMGNIAREQGEANKQRIEATKAKHELAHAKKMNTWLKLSENPNRSDKQQKMFDKLTHELLGDE